MREILASESFIKGGGGKGKLREGTGDLLCSNWKRKCEWSQQRKCCFYIYKLEICMGIVIKIREWPLLISITPNGSLQFSTCRILNAKNSKLNKTEGAAKSSLAINLFAGQRVVYALCRLNLRIFRRTLKINHDKGQSNRATMAMDINPGGYGIPNCIRWLFPSQTNSAYHWVPPNGTGEIDANKYRKGDEYHGIAV